jgi:indole-3-glycerol phosphate synthase
VSELEPILEATREDVARRRRELPLSELERRLGERGERRSFSQALRRSGLSVIAEHKRRSPSAGDIRPGSSVAEIAGAYERAGAAALSVLTEGRFFGGSLEDLREARAAATLPVLRKDFVLDRYQVYESAAAGADAILLIVAALADADLALLHREALDLGLDVLVEVHEQDELARALEIAGAGIVGINNRSLRDLSVDVQRTYELLSGVPAGTVVVSESGLHSREQLERLAGAGVDAVLVGESLMRAADPEQACRALTGVGGEL